MPDDVDVLARVVHTHELSRRPGTRDAGRENEIFRALAQALADDPGDVPRRILEAARALCGAASAGVSVFEVGAAREPGFVWLAVAGSLAAYEGRRVPRRASPCGVAFERGGPQLFIDPARAFDDLTDITPRISEQLLVPFFAGAEPLGALWVASHDGHGFTAEHARVLESLAAFAATAVRSAAALRSARAGERVLATLTEHLPVGIYVCDAPSATIRFYNRRAAELWGREPTLDDPVDRFCGSLRLYRPDGTRLPHDECPMADALGGRVQRNLEVQIERPDGSRRWALVNIAPIHDDDGAVIGAVNAFLDVTELKAAQDALRHSEAELHDFFENGALPLHWVGPDGTILRANRAELELLGYDREEYVGRKIRDFHVDAEAIDDILARLTAGESLHNYPARLRAKDGSIRDVLITSNVFRREGEFVHTRCFTRDVSDLRRIAAEREALLAREQAARTAAEAAARAKDEFLAMLGHELRNPLGVITNAVAILDRVGATIPSAVSARGAIRRHAGHLGALVDDLLDVARVTLGKIALKRARLDLGHATMRWLATFRSSGNADAHEIVADVATVWVDADETRIDQIASNLIGNAVKYTPAGGRIRVSVRREGDEAIFEVTDSGVGISSALLPRVFDLFTQGERTLARSEGGLGLGLTLVKHLAELHGGRAEAASDGPGQGARFTVRLPVAAPAEAAGMAVAERRAVAPAARRVLLVEDNDDAREMLRMLLELDGHEVHEAADGITALEKAPVLAPDVVILDVGLPGIDGYETARRLRALPRGRSMRLVAVTGYGQPGDKRLAQEAGFDGHIVKPVDTDALRRQLAS